MELQSGKCMIKNLSVLTQSTVTNQPTDAPTDRRVKPVDDCTGDAKSHMPHDNNDGEM